MILGSTIFHDTFDLNVFCLFCFVSNLSAKGTASIQASNQLSTGGNQEEFQAESGTAECSIPLHDACNPTEHVHPSTGANPSPAHASTLARDRPPVAIADASSSLIPPDAIVDASSGANSSAALVNTLANGSPPVAIAYPLSGVIHPDAIVGASSGTNPFHAHASTLASGSPPGAIC